MLTFQLVIRLIVSACFELFIIYMVVCKRQQGEENALAQKPLPRLSLPWMSLSWMHCAHRQMSSLYARATAARPKPSQTSRGRVGSIYLTRKKSRLLRPLIAPRARCASVRRHGLGCARSRSLLEVPWRPSSSSRSSIPVDRLGL
jgi:hypothetical protein